MTTSDEELVKAITSYRQADADGVIVKVSREACDKAASAITRLTRELASARAAGAEEMREAIAQTYDAKAAEFQKIADDAAEESAVRGGFIEHAKREHGYAARARALPLPYRRRVTP